MFNFVEANRCANYLLGGGQRKNQPKKKKPPIRTSLSRVFFVVILRILEHIKTICQKNLSRFFGSFCFSKVTICDLELNLFFALCLSLLPTPAFRLTQQNLFLI